jgi:hypothetical protein
MGCTCSHPKLSQTEPVRGPNSQPTSEMMPLPADFSLPLLPTAKRFSRVPGMLNSSEVKVLYPT